VLRAERSHIFREWPDNQVAFGLLLNKSALVKVKEVKHGTLVETLLTHKFDDVQLILDLVGAILNYSPELAVAARAQATHKCLDGQHEPVEDAAGQPHLVLHVCPGFLQQLLGVFALHAKL
jgi:hypothetical protein